MAAESASMMVCGSDSLLIEITVEDHLSNGFEVLRVVDNEAVSSFSVTSIEQ
jgi:hypothetical protein